MNPGTRRRAHGWLVLAWLVGVGGCGGTQAASTLDTTATERAIKKVVGGRIAPDVDDVRCPSDIPRGVGKRVTCRAVLADGKGAVRLTVRQTNPDGQLDIALADAVIDLDDVAEDLRRQLVATYKRTFEVDCGASGPEVVEPNTTLTCEASDATGKRPVAVRVLDAAGTLRYDVAG